MITHDDDRVVAIYNARELIDEATARIEFLAGVANAATTARLNEKARLGYYLILNDMLNALNGANEGLGGIQ